LAKVLEKKFGIAPELIKSSGGVFEVTVDGNLIFSKKKTHRFPDNQEIIDSIQELK
jgi:selenoprotein W-related protein